MTVELWFVRHGEAENNRSHLVTGGEADPLTEEGRLQAGSMGAYLRNKLNFQPDLTVTSNMVRTWQTLEAMDYPCAGERLKELNETDAGSVSYWKRDRFDAEYADFWSPFDPRRPFPDGESHQDMYERVNACMDRLVSSCRKGRILMVAHGGTLSSIMHRAYNVPLEHFSRFVVGNASLTILRFSEKGAPPHLLAFNVAQ